MTMRTRSDVPLNRITALESLIEFAFDDQVLEILQGMNAVHMLQLNMRQHYPEILLNRSRQALVCVRENEIHMEGRALL